MEVDRFYHYGVKGMKWGVRRSQAELDRAKGRKSSNSREQRRAEAKSLSDTELRSRINRLQMEKQYVDLTAGPDNSKIKKGGQVVSNVLGNVAKNVAVSQLTKGGNKAVQAGIRYAINKM